MYEYRASLECLGVRLACERITAEETEWLRAHQAVGKAALASSDMNAYRIYNADLHTAILRAARNSYLSGAMGQVSGSEPNAGRPHHSCNWQAFPRNRGACPAHPVACQPRLAEGPARDGTAHPECPSRHSSVWAQTGASGMMRIPAILGPDT
jgi:hypothetical protein